MILLDTNVISEVTRPEPNRSVARWMRGMPRAALVTSVVVQAELLYGLAIMPDGRKRRLRLAQIEAVFATIGTILPLNADAAAVYSEIASQRRAAGRPLPGFDGLIAATARVAGAAIATRDVADFEGCGVELVDPWAA